MKTTYIYRMSQQENSSFLRYLQAGNQTYSYYSLQAAAEAGLMADWQRLPRSLKVVFENLLRFYPQDVQRRQLQAVADPQQAGRVEIPYRPSRVLMQDFTGVPGVVDLAAMRDAMARNQGAAQKINPQVPVEMVIDHSVIVDAYASPEAFATNVAHEMERNKERYTLLRWAQQAFDNFWVVPPGTGICHQVNLEYLARVVWSDTQQEPPLAYPDTLVGTDSHTPMVNGLGVLGWGVGGIEAEAAMLQQPVAMLVPEVVGVRLQGQLPAGATATDLVLSVTERLRRYGVVGKFVEFFGPGLAHLTVADRATVANMAPEYGATCGFFPIDEQTLDYLRLSGRAEADVQRVAAYSQAQGLWGGAGGQEPLFQQQLEIDLNTIEPSVAGPKRPQDRLPLGQVKANSCPAAGKQAAAVPGRQWQVPEQGVVIAAITSCTNTSNPVVMLAAGLVAQKAVERGLQVPPWVKTSLAPGSKVVSAYLRDAGLQAALDHLGFRWAMAVPPVSAIPVPCCRKLNRPSGKRILP